MSESKKPNLKRFNMNMPEDLHAYLKDVAVELNVSLSAVVTLAVEKFREQRIMAYSMQEMLEIAKRQEEQQKALQNDEKND